MALHPQHQAKELGTMVKRALAQTDWLPTHIPQVTYSPKTQTYCISVKTLNTAALQHKQLSRQHGREQTDHSDAQSMIDSLPTTLWSHGPTDVGLVDCEPVSFEMQATEPIWI